MAPEQADLKPVNSCTDIYAVGLLLYEMVTGVPAFSGDSPVAVAIKQIRDYPQRPREIVPQLSRAIESVIMKCLQKDPARRFQSADALDNALVKAAKARPLSPWEAAVNRWGAMAEAEVRRQVREGMEAAEKLFDQKDVSAPVGIQHEPKAILGMAGMIGALTVFLSLGGWKTNTISAQTVPSPGQTSHSFTPAAGGFASASTSLSAEIPVSPITSRNVSLYEDAKPESLQSSPSAADSSTENLSGAHVAAAEPASKPAPKPKLAKLVVPSDKTKSQKNVASSANAQTSASSAPTESIAASNSSGQATLAPVATPMESNAALLKPSCRCEHRGGLRLKLSMAIPKF